MIATLFIINLVTCAIWAWDKYASMNMYWRVPEKTLLMLGLIGGGLGGLVGMFVFRHKTRKLPFKALFLLTIPASFLVVKYLLR
jgi:uncharacterized membrane protein YsdA (DUF1294 family)